MGLQQGLGRQQGLRHQGLGRQQTLGRNQGLEATDTASRESSCRRSGASELVSRAGGAHRAEQGRQGGRRNQEGGWFNKCQALVDLIVEERWQDAKALAISLDCNAQRA
ncbi:hypothetical protein N9L68_07510 [bacterium]|nr:hypothetical protein [bacterium]